jgi:hypothetical protein
MTVAAPRRRADRDEHRIRSGHRRPELGREGQPTGRHVGRHQGLQPGLVNRQLAAPQPGDLRRIPVDAEHLDPKLRKTRPRYQTHIPRPDHRDAHRIDFPRTIGCRAAPAPLAVLARDSPPPSFINSAQLAQIVPYSGRLAPHIDRRSENCQTVRCLNLFRGENSESDPRISREFPRHPPSGDRRPRLLGHHPGYRRYHRSGSRQGAQAAARRQRQKPPAICDWRTRRASGASGLGRVHTLRRGSGCRTNGVHFTHLFLGQTLSR